MIDHLSYSSINHYLMCGRSWRYHYVDKVSPKEKAEALLFGSAWHKMIGLVGGVGEVNEQTWRTAITGVKNGVPIYETLLPESIELGQRMIESATILTHLRGISPWKMEQYFEFTVPNVPMPIVGYIDMITNDMVPVDFKTASRKWSPAKADSDLQATFYIAGMHKLGLIKSSQFPYPFEYHIFTKTKTPDIQILRTERTAEQVIGLFNLIGEVWGAIEKDVYVPNSTGWKCSPKYCDFWDRCKGGMIDVRD